MPYYATLQGCLTAYRQLDTTATANNQEIADLIPRASQVIENICRQNFDERIATGYFSVQVGLPDLNFRGVPVLAVTTLLNGDGTTIDNTSYVLLPRTGYPKKRITLTLTQTYWTPDTTMPLYEDSDGNRLSGVQSYWGVSQRSSSSGGLWIYQGIAVTGKFGFHQDYLNAWLDSGKKVSGSWSSSSTTLTVNSVGTTIDVGSVLRIDSEYVVVTGPVLNTSAATSFTVKRGYNGSTAATHANDTAIYVWQTESTIVEATERLVAAMYKSRDNATGDRMVVEGLGAISIPSGIPSKVRDLLIPPYYNVIGGVLS